jgi:hypothetical protein
MVCSLIHFEFFKSMKLIYRLLFLSVFAFSAYKCSVIPSGRQEGYDLVIYGGTPGGITAAVQAARMGKSVLLIETGKRLGGASSGGLGWADIGVEQTIGGMSLEFFERVYHYYQQDSAWKWQKRSDYQPKGNHGVPEGGPMWSFEPKVSKHIFEQMVGEQENITLVYNERLDLAKRVEMNDGNIIAVTTESGRTFRGRYFVDASYEADLMALAGVSYHVGRESRATYNEQLAGVLGPTVKNFQPKQFFGPDVSPYDEEGKLLPTIQDVPMGEPGQGDKKIQAYNFRICLTTTPENRLPIPRPKNYEPKTYELLRRYIQVKNLNSIRRILTISPLPNNKTDINDGGHGCPFSTDYNGMNWEYPEGSYSTRENIWQDHYGFTAGLLYFLANDPGVPESIRKEMLEYGLPKDEYDETNNWTPQLYIRETRRMIGMHVLTQNDCQVDTTKENSIGLASYGPDSHHVQRIVYKNGEVINEGNFLEHHKPYEIPLGVILPRREECKNLLVPVCVSSTHIAFGSIRMEPVFMIMGQAAATVAVLALEKNIAVQDVEYKKIKQQLISDKQLLKLQDVPVYN